MFFSNLHPYDVVGRNTALLAGRDAGKTTFLKTITEYVIGLGKSVVIIDSACDHVEKSIVKYYQQRYAGAVYIDSAAAEEVLRLDEDFSRNRRPGYFSDVMKGAQVVLADVSEYLERGYDAEGEQRAQLRRVYKRLAAELLFSCLDVVPGIIVMDEIELLPLSSLKEVIAELNRRGTFVIDAIHSADYISGFESMFVIAGEDDGTV